MEIRRQGLTLFTALVIVVAVIVVVQLWLVAASLDALLSGDLAPLTATTAVSLALFLTNLAVLRQVTIFDFRVRNER